MHTTFLEPAVSLSLTSASSSLPSQTTGAAILVDDPSAHFPPSSSDLDAFHIAREADIASQRKATLSATAATRARFEERLSLAGSEAGSESGAMSTKEEREAERAREKRAKREEARKSAEEERRKREGEDDQEMEQPAARPSTSSTSAASSMPAAGDSLPPPESLQAAARRSPAEQEQADVLSLSTTPISHTVHQAPFRGTVLMPPRPQTTDRSTPTRPSRTPHGQASGLIRTRRLIKQDVRFSRI